jgi:hypothetical protein
MCLYLILLKKVKYKKIYSRSAILCICFTLLLFSRAPYAQSPPSYTDLKAYFDTPRVFDTEGGLLYFKWDSYGAPSGELRYDIYDWKREKQASGVSAVFYGVNRYAFDISRGCPDCKEGAVYTLEIPMFKETGKKSFSFKYLTGKSLNAELDWESSLCGSDKGFLTSFYVGLSGGRSAYTVSWYISRMPFSEERQEWGDPVKQEKVSEASVPGPSGGLCHSSLESKEVPDYYILIFVEDECGGYDIKTNKVVCPSDGQERPVTGVVTGSPAINGGGDR